MNKHFTATAYIVAKINNQKKVLLHKHRKLGIWIGIGGHIENEENPMECVLREIKEETDLCVRLISKKRLLKTSNVRELILPITIIEEDIPAYGNILAHRHTDLIFFAFCEDPKNINIDTEFKWFNKNDLKEAELLKEVFVFASKALVSI